MCKTNPKYPHLCATTNLLLDEEGHCEYRCSEPRPALFIPVIMKAMTANTNSIEGVSTVKMSAADKYIQKMHKWIQENLDKA